MAYRASLTPAEAAHADLCRLWLANLPVSSAHDAEAKFQWFYLGAPAGAASAFLLRSDAADGDGDHAVGCAGIGTRAFGVPGQVAVLSAALLADLAVDKRHRTALPALIMQRAVRKHCQATFDFSYGFPNEHAVAVHLRLGFQLLGRMGRWAKVLRHSRYVDPLLPRALRVPLIARATGGVVDRALAARELPGRLVSRRRFRLELITTPATINSRFDELWERARLRYPICTARTAAFLRWRYFEKPGSANRVAVLISRHDRRVVGYAVVNAHGHVASLLDVFGETDDAIDSLLALLAPALREDGFASISIGYLGAGNLRRVLMAQGYSLREETRAVIVDAGARLPFDAVRLYDANNWYITDGDEDA